MKRIISILLATAILVSFMNACYTPKTPTSCCPDGKTLTPYASRTVTTARTGTPTVAFTPTVTVTTAPEGSIWTKAANTANFSVRAETALLEYNGLMWIIAGSSGGIPGCVRDAWSSMDGITWSCATSAAPFSARYGLTALAFTNTSGGPNPGVEKMWIMGGYNGSYWNDVWYSTDGATWTQATAAAGFGYKADHTSVVFNGAMWVIAGSSTGPVWNNDVWYSADGVDWTLATGNAAFSARAQHSSVVYNGEMWVIGGKIGMGSTFYNDVWHSSDGINWYCATSNAAFPKRYGHKSAVYDGKMWVFGGQNTSGTDLNDIWSSSDGITWTQTTVAMPFSARACHAAITYNNKMWVMTGVGPAGYLNDVWWSQ